MKQFNGTMYRINLNQDYIQDIDLMFIGREVYWIQWTDEYCYIIANEI